MSSRKRVGGSGRRDRKQITVAQVRRPILAADRRSLERGRGVAQREHRSGLDDFARRVLGLPERTAADRDTAEPDRDRPAG